MLLGDNPMATRHNLHGKKPVMPGKHYVSDTTARVGTSLKHC